MSKFGNYLFSCGVIGIIVLIFCFVCLVVIAPIFVAMTLATFLNLNGFLWWCAFIVIWFILSSLMGSALS